MSPGLRRLAVLVLLFWGVPVLAGQPALTSLTLQSGRDRDGGFVLAGRDSSQQLIATGTTPEGRALDLTGQAAYSAEPAGVVHIDPTGFVTPLSDGTATLTARAGGQEARLAVTVRHMTDDVPVLFAGEVVPAFTRLGCNAGGCHGKATGQNGFKLSLLGFEPDEDHEALVKEARGRRLFLAAPERSLLLTKATGQAPHGGGKRLDPSSPFYRLLLAWIRQGAPASRPDDPVVTGIELLPRERILGRSGRQQLAVVARFSDGTSRDVTRMSQFEVNQPDLAGVSDTGLVTARQVPGRAAVMARFGSHVAVFGATVPLGVPVERLPPRRTFIDDLDFRQLKALGLPPSPECDDATFLRRATIDVCGRLPTPGEVDDYLADRHPARAERLIDRLLADGAHADYFAAKWSARLRNRRASAQEDPRPTAAFHAWIRKSIAENVPYDQFVRVVLTATGEEVATPAVVWFRELKEPAALVEDAAQLFLGQRLGCAKCHHHPFDRWSQADYYGMAAFFSTVQVKLPPPPPKKSKALAVLSGGKPAASFASVLLAGKRPQAINPRTGRPVRPTTLLGEAPALAPGDDAREKLAAWMTARDNPFFARALVNRYWKHFMGRGLVEPEDDMRLSNPPSNPELLDALARSFVESGYDLKRLVRTICTSTVYRLSAAPNEHNAHDRQNHSRFVLKRLHAEVLLDAINDVTLSRTDFRGRPAQTRAVQLPDNLTDSYFLSVFGRPDGASACECERSSGSSLAQYLHLLNSQEVLLKVSGPRAKGLAGDRRPHAERLRDLYKVAFARPPRPAELAVLLGHIERKGGDVQGAYEDILWAIINSNEFLYNH
jgi:hypothetical protein